MPAAASFSRSWRISCCMDCMSSQCASTASEDVGASPVGAADARSGESSATSALASGRSDGEVDRHRAITTSSCGRSAASPGGRTPWRALFIMCARSMSVATGEYSSTSIMPRLKISDLSLQLVPSSCSGAAYATVPTPLVISSSDSDTDSPGVGSVGMVALSASWRPPPESAPWNSRAKPKSPSFRSPSRAKKQFAGLRSL
mmetsp:Transcript_15257/g.35993  ORF Transcript_15257/g.35993 Transcript_15257/m.35993 type:complete len:202 (-) Transcript_15257:1182-1787(-)